MSPKCKADTNTCRETRHRNKSGRSAGPCIAPDDARQVDVQLATFPPVEQLGQTMVELRHEDAHAASGVYLWHAQRRPRGAQFHCQLLKVCLHLRRSVRHMHAAACRGACLFTGPFRGVIGEHSPAVKLGGTGRPGVVNLCEDGAVRTCVSLSTPAPANLCACRTTPAFPRSEP